MRQVAQHVDGYFMLCTLCVCIPVTGCTTTHQLDITDQCNLYPTVEWTRLAIPPPEAGQILASVRGDASHGAKGAALQEAWFRAENDRLRYCRYGRAKDPCNGIPEVIDFQSYYGKWNVVGGGLQEICLDGPDRITQRADQ
jgi:hypothetical protein